jgi:Tfp pilus assembly PilM family ATPase
MRYLLKDFFSPKSVLGLEITDTFIGAVQTFNSVKGLEIDRIAFREIEDPEEMPRQLAEFFRKENLKSEVLITCLSSASAIIRQIPLPIAKPKKLGKIIKYQMEPYVPYPVDDMVVGFLPAGPEGKVTTIGVRKESMVQHMTSLSQADLEPQMVSIDDVALFSLCLKDASLDTDQTISIVHLSNGKMTVQVVNENRLDFIRIIPEGLGDTDQLIKTFKIYQLEKPDVQITKILLTGHRGVNDDVAAEISTALNIETSPWRPFDNLRHGFGELQTDFQARLSVPLGLALSVSDPPDKTFDLRKDEFGDKRATDFNKVFLFMLTAVLLLVFLFTFSTYQKLHLRNKRHNKLKHDIALVFSKTFPETKHIIKGQEPAQMKQKIEEEMGKHKWVEDLTSGERVLDVLTVLTRTISAFPSLRLDDLSVEEKEIRIYGHAPSFEMVDRLKQKLLDVRSFKATRLVDAKMDKKEKTVRFNFALEKN